MAKIAQDAMEPGVQGRFTTKPMRRFKGLEKSFLNQILSVGFATAQ
jgi:hypothetical protein